MARPKTRDVVREEIAAMTPALAEAIAKILGANPQATVARIAPAPKVEPRRTVAPTRVAGAKRERVEKAPEGGYADRISVVPADRGDQPRPELRGFTKAQVEEILGGNFNVYFYRSSDEKSVKPAKQVRDALIAAGFGFTASHNMPRWYGRRDKLPADFRGAIES